MGAHVALYHLDQLNLLLTTVMLEPELIGGVFFPVQSIYRKLENVKDGLQEITYVTPTLCFDLSKDGVTVGCVFISAETKDTPPPAERIPMDVRIQYAPVFPDARTVRPNAFQDHDSAMREVEETDLRLLAL